MSLYRYTAFDTNGKATKGRIEAESETHAIRKLKSSGLFLETIAEARGSSLLRKQFGSHRGLKKALPLSFTQLASLVASNMPLVDALDALAASEPNQTLSGVFANISSGIRGGSTFSDTLGHYPHIFDDTIVSLIRAAESSGNLESVLNSLAETMNRRREVNAKLLSALAYPSAVFMVGIAVVVFMLTSVVPMVTQVFEGAKATLPMITQIVLAASDFLAAYGILLFFVIVAGTTLFVFLYKKNLSWQRWVAKILLRLPIIGNLLVKTILARFGNTLSSMLSGGVPLVRALEQSAAVSGNIYVQEKIIEVAQRVVQGMNVDAALKNAAVFPDLFVNMVGTGRKAGNLPDMIHRVAIIYQMEAMRVIDAFLAIIEPLMILLIGTLVAVIMAATLLPIFELNTLIR
ncbi:type II secretion system F family protein [Chrysiogenes arsenatis]|uniref:type II secretion system F family protein n=1 Tax=Chrysiogenes arsenatis TaxID=309797 RepID=UPI0004045114|nr:type II secretion system F family protein [Chrysiogenes arsenatis]